MKKTYLSVFVLLCGFLTGPSQVIASHFEESPPCHYSPVYLYWTGEEDNDFFNERNWRQTTQRPARMDTATERSMDVGSAKPTCLPDAFGSSYLICLNDHELTKDKRPVPGTLSPGKPIEVNLYVSAAVIKVDEPLVFACERKGLMLSNSQLILPAGIERGVIAMDQESTLKVSASDLSPTAFFDFLDAASWVYWNGMTPDVIGETLEGQIMRQGTEASPNVDYRINQYYQTGSLIRPRDEAFAPLMIFSEVALGGRRGELTEMKIYRGAEIPNGMNDQCRSFILKRGYMATFAVEPNGTGKSKVFIASEEDMVLENIPEALEGNVSFIRVVPWNWVTKKGTGGFYDQLNAGWYYNWGLGAGSRPNYENVPMAWGAGGASPASVKTIIERENVTHFLGFNESDHCTSQSGQFNNLCQPEVAVAYFEGLMGSGLRIGSPAPRENGPFTWLKEFYRIAKERDVRFDFVAVHWYDWGSNPANTPNADPQQIFNRFKNYLERVYALYQMPIWITEFNANPNRGNAIQLAFLKLALPYLESLDYVERYAYFQPDPKNAQNQVEPAFFFDANGDLTNIGSFYRRHESAPSIPAATFTSSNSLDGMDLPFVPDESVSLVYEAECGSYLGTQWDIVSDSAASNELFIRGNLADEPVNLIARQVHFEFELEAPDTYRFWIRAHTGGVNGSMIIKMDDGEPEQIGAFNSGAFVWFQVPRFYAMKEGKHRMTLQFPNSSMRLDRVAFVNGSTDVQELSQEAGFCEPTANFWGTTQTNILVFIEGESGISGSSWVTSEDDAASADRFIETPDQFSLETPPGSDGVLEFEVDVESADEYEIWAKIGTVDAESEESSLWIAVDDDPFRKWSGLESSVFKWYWKRFHFSYGDEQRSFSYFLGEGSHRIRIAYASGNVAIDRVALASAGLAPEEADPNVLKISDDLEFEAEYAVLLGGAVVVGCATSSNVEQVNMGTVNANGVRFDQIVSAQGGRHRLEISYMSAVVRSFRLVVNGVSLGQQSVSPSGPWCFNGGSPDVFEIDVPLKAGVNVIDITPFNGAAPFIDKIKLVLQDDSGAGVITSFEAEDAELLGNTPIQNCNKASNGRMVNIGTSVDNGIRFNEIVLQETGIYDVDVYYITLYERAMTIVNGIVAFSESFEPSGPWCFDGGSPAIKTLQMRLEKGANLLEFRPTGAEAPIIDKIVVREPAHGDAEAVVKVSGNAREFDDEPTIASTALSETEESEVYPNPVRAGEQLTIRIPGLDIEGIPIKLQMTDISGKTMFTEEVTPETRSIPLEIRLNKGLYIVSIRIGSRTYYRRVEVD